MNAPDRAVAIGRAVEVFVVWSRVLDSHRTFPFGDLQLSRSQTEVLFLVAHADAPLSPGRLAEALGVTRGAVTQLVAGLVATGLVEQRTDLGDARRRTLGLTAESRDRVDGFEQAIVRELSPRFDALADSELETLAGLLARTREV